MADLQPGRLLAASLAEALQEFLPQRVDFYEHWLNSDRLRDRRDHLAAMSAVLGFLRTEGDAYHHVMARAGQLSGHWVFETAAPWRRRAATSSPQFVRARLAIGALADLVTQVHAASRATRFIRRRQAEIGVSDSLFCAVREASQTPLCGFYLSAAIELFQQCGVPVHGRTTDCRAVSGGRCQLVVDWSRTSQQTPPAVAA
jgi:hypothetical protein